MSRAATVKLPLGQLAVVGLGAFCVTNPDKFFSAIQKGTQLYLADFAPQNQSRKSSQQPIVIHHAAPASSRSATGTIVQLVIGAGFCWGSYMVLVNVLPDAAKGMLPVTTRHFNRAVTSLGKGVINLKETLMEQVRGLSKKQDDLSERQEETYVEVLHVKDNVSDLKGDLSLVQESLDLCHATLSESERRTSYIARGVQLLTRGVSTFLPENEGLMHELIQFNSAGEEFNNAAPVQQQRLREIVQSVGDSEDRHEVSTPPLLEDATDVPESKIPKTPADDVERSLTEVRALLSTVRYGNQ